MADLGRAALFVSLGLALYATVVGALAAHLKKRRLADSAGNALLAALGSTAVASAVLLSALVRHDFSFVYVAQHTSTELPTGYSLSAFWGDQAGSLLLWLLVLSAYSAAAGLLKRRPAPDLVAWTLPSSGGGPGRRPPARPRSPHPRPPPPTRWGAPPRRAGGSGS